MNEKKIKVNIPRLIFFIAIIGILVWMFVTSSNNSKYQEANMSVFMEAVSEGKVKNAQIIQSQFAPSGQVIFTTDEGDYKFNTTDVSYIELIVAQAGIADYDVAEVSEKISITTIIIIVAGFILVIIIMNMLTMGMNGGANSKMMDFGKSRAQMVKDSKVKFSDVAGLTEEKEDLIEIVEFLKDPKKFTDIGARIPKGVLLVGPPGTGKTLMAKAIAGEAKVPFFSISGSDFVEMFVGVGASRVRDLFDSAKKNAPCIVFIDEIDAVARHRGSGLGGGHDEREQTLNQLLVEMDGFGINEGIIVLAATNRVDILDPAIMRPGRFDRKIAVGRPDVKARKEILDVHAKNKPLSDDVDLDRISRTTVGFTGADLENLLNESAIKAAKEGRKFISHADIEAAFVKVGLGTEKKSRVISERDKKITAYHEAGHAILFHLLPNVGPVHTVSIIPTGVGAAGYTMPLPENDYMHKTRGAILDEVMATMGGRLAEEIVFDDITTGASQDIKQATALVHDMVTKYGMSEKIGFFSCGEEEEVFLGKDYAKERAYSEHMAQIIDEEEQKILGKCYEDAKKILLDNRDKLDKCVELLMEKEKITQEEFESIFAEE